MKPYNKRTWLNLRPYQQQSITATRALMQKNKHVILQLPTGAGKTICFTYIAQGASKKNSNVLVLTNRTELLNQTGNTFDKFSLTPQYISPKHTKVPDGKLVVSMAQTLQRRISKPEWLSYIKNVDIVIIDECHTSDCDFLFPYLSPHTYVIGCTATPMRTGTQTQLGLQYQGIAEGVSVNELINEGFLCPCDHYIINAPKIKAEISYATGDFNINQLGKDFDKKLVYKGMLDQWQKIANNKKTVVFCASQEHSEKTCKEFRDRGIKAYFLISGKPTLYPEYTYGNEYKNRKELLEGFDRGEFDVIVNGGILVAGWDCPSVECVVLNTKTASLTKFLQMIGRGSRPYPNKEKFILLDCGANVQEHGRYEQERKWGLYHRTGSTGNGIEPVKECKQCGCIIMQTVHECPFCGYVYPTAQEERTIELELLTKDTNVSEMTVSQLRAYTELKGYHINWCLRKLFMRNDENMFKRIMKEEFGYDYKYIYRLTQMFKR